MYVYTKYIDLFTRMYVCIEYVWHDKYTVAVYKCFLLNETCYHPIPTQFCTDSEQPTVCVCKQVYLSMVYQQ